MSDYSGYASQAITDDTAVEYVFGLLIGEPALRVAPATKQNTAFHSEALRRSLAENAAKAGKVAPDPTPESIIADEAKALATDRELIARFCVRGWGKNPPKPAGAKEAAPFSAEEALAFLQAVPPEHFEPFKNFVKSNYNFMPISQISEEQAGQTGN
jgi:hypothetical protein